MSDQGNAENLSSNTLQASSSSADGHHVVVLLSPAPQNCEDFSLFMGSQGKHATPNTYPATAGTQFHVMLHCRYPHNCRPRRQLEVVGRQSICCSSSKASEKSHQLLLECTRSIPAGYLPALAVANLKTAFEVKPHATCKHCSVVQAFLQQVRSQQSMI